MKKRIALICAAVMLLMSVAQSVGAVNVIMNSSFLKFPDQEPVVVEGTTLVPLRSVAEALGLEVTWDDPTDTVVVKKDNFYIELVIGSTKAKTPGGVKTLLQPPVIINGRTMVPLRFIAEQFGLTVLWNQEYQRVVINGQVDTQTVVKPPVEEVSEAEGEALEGASDTEDNAVKEGEADEDEEEVIEEETEIIIEYTSIDLPSKSIMLEIPDTYFPEDTDSEESFAFRSLDGFDAQHTYNWEIVTTYESYADEDAKNGLLYIVQEFEPYEGEEYEVSILEEEYPEAPERPMYPEYPEEPEEAKFVEDERTRLALMQMYEDAGVEFPEDMEVLFENLMSDLGYENGWDLMMAINEVVETIDASEIEGYDIWLQYQEETQAIRDGYNEEVEMYNEARREYDREVARINQGRAYVYRNYATLFEQMEEDKWVEFFSSQLNVDEEVRYEDIEIADIDGEKLIKATIYAEDPDDEQGTYVYYRYQKGDTLVTIFGGTLFGSEASEEIREILAGMIIQ